MTPTELAAAHGLNEDSIFSFLAYMKHEITAKPALADWLRTDTDACMKAGLKGWLKASNALAAELIAGETQRAKDLHTQVADAVWRRANP